MWIWNICIPSTWYETDVRTSDQHPYCPPSIETLWELLFKTSLNDLFNRYWVDHDELEKLNVSSITSVNWVKINWIDWIIDFDYNEKGNVITINHYRFGVSKAYFNWNEDIVDVLQTHIDRYIINSEKYYKAQSTHVWERQALSTEISDWSKNESLLLTTLNWKINYFSQYGFTSPFKLANWKFILSHNNYDWVKIIVENDGLNSATLVVKGKHHPMMTIEWTLNNPNFRERHSYFK